jgi:Domain of unknown function (DUF4112)
VGLLTDQNQRLNALRSIQRFLDEAYRIPGTSSRFGWDPIIGLIPGLGDIVTGLLSTAIIIEAYRMRTPGVILLRMLLNVGLDLVVGVVPLVGDAVDFFWKANTKNMALLERHGVAEHPPTWRDWVFVGAIVGAVLVMAMIPLVVLYLIAREITGLTR